MQLTTPGVDHDVTEWVADHRTAWLTDVFRVITTVGNTAAMTLIAIVAAIVLWRIGSRDRAVTVLIGSASGWLLMQALKHLVARPRPEPRFRVIAIDTYSFPSGHAMMSAVVLGLVAVAAWQTSVWVRAHAPVLAIAPIASLLIGASRIYLGVHWTTDVVAGWLIGAIWVVLAVAVARAVGQRRRATVSADDVS
ncbi:MAG: phosphatase PAP2 family protein [Corynebacteriales bacterium]|uniref:Phosphatase PAP2 family protein n=1 Tax=Williamsia herbipolensis TaxID=1603258 RepID=A0AAU4K0T6_9NOCA|nr:phosphatase PAP2 family protein [Williamsia herbipolensis]MCX6467858.1 phosphatase PAP2 family protein [Mycobacteriales bacterium]